MLTIVQPISLAEMYYLDKDMKLSQDADSAWYKMEAEKVSSGSGWDFSVTRKNGSRVASTVMAPQLLRSVSFSMAS